MPAVPYTVLVADILIDAGGNPPNGSYTITAPPFASRDGFSIGATVINQKFKDGLIVQPLVPNTEVTDPAGHVYTVQFKTAAGGQWTETWKVPNRFNDSFGAGLIAAQTATLARVRQ